MRTFKQYIESIVDPKNNPRLQSWNQESDDSDPSYYRKNLGKTAQYPLAHIEKDAKGFQVKSPEEFFKKRISPLENGMSERDLVDTLKSKLYAKEPMTMREINFLIKKLDQAYEEA